jgi:NAD(P)-dependent dehydrogenase (short-subunit alcohol dehydrogenase family)
VTNVDPFGLAGRVAVVTGGGRGVGRGMAVALARAGATVVVASRTAAELGETLASIAEAGGSASAVASDLADPAAAKVLVDEVVSRHGRIDVLVHAAGNQVRRPALEITAAEWDSIQALHLRAAFLLAQAAGAHMVQQRSGSIVFVGSMTSERAGIENIAPYAAAKSGLLGLTRTLAVEWGAHAVRVNTVAVGFFPTAMSADVDADPRRQALVARIPMDRVGTPEDLAGPVVFLASDASAYVTGQCLAVDGGWTVA